MISPSEARLAETRRDTEVRFANFVLFHRTGRPIANNACVNPETWSEYQPLTLNRKARRLDHHH